jgi:hypothetical protein
MGRRGKQKAKAEKRAAFQQAKAWKKSDKYLKGPKKKDGMPVQTHTQKPATDAPRPAVKRPMPDFFMPEFRPATPEEARRYEGGRRSTKEAAQGGNPLQSGELTRAQREELLSRMNNHLTEPRENRPAIRKKYGELGAGEKAALLVRHHVAYQGKNYGWVLQEVRGGKANAGLGYIKSLYKEGRI